MTKQTSFQMGLRTGSFGTPSMYGHLDGLPNGLLNDILGFFDDASRLDVSVNGPANNALGLFNAAYHLDVSMNNLANAQFYKSIST